MVQAIGSAPSTAPFVANGSTGGLQAQLVQAQSKLADCLHCATANTPEGKAQIQAWTVRVHNLEARIHEVETAQRKQAVALLAGAPTEAVNQISAAGEPSTLPLALGGRFDRQG